MKYFFVLLLVILPNTSFAERVSFEDAKKHYIESDLRILIVPGHSNREWGTTYRGVREAHLNVELAGYLQQYLSTNKNIKSFVTRNTDGTFAPWFASYTEKEKDSVDKFRSEKASAMRASIQSGAFKKVTGVGHNTATSITQHELFSVNKFANDNRIDLALHIHFNDHAGRKETNSGKYSGAAIYIPDNQFVTHESSLAFAKPIFNRLLSITHPSTLPGESSGIVNEQGLIATGVSDTRDGASMLIEYAYIYEPQLHSKEVRSRYLREVAYLTYLGIVESMGDSIITENKFQTTLLPNKWSRLPPRGVQTVESLSMQRALVFEGVYPPTGKSTKDCAISGYFGPCSMQAIIQLKQKNNIASIEKTLEYLNSRYSEQLSTVTAMK